MSLLKSYSFSQGVPYEVWELFSKADKLGTKLDYTLEIIDAAMNGDISLERKFNLEAYINSINRTKRLEGLRQARKVKRIDDNWGDPYDDSDSISEESLMGYVEQVDEYEKLADDDEVRFAVSEINKLATSILLQNHLEIYTCITQALKGIPESVRLLQGLAADNPHAGELLKIILSSGYAFEDLFPERGGVLCLI